MNKMYFFKWLLPCIVVVLVATNCTPSQETQQEETASIRPTIKLAKNPWLSAELNTVVAQLILEEELGYPVELITIDDRTQYPALEKGDIHASLKVWPLGRAGTRGNSLRATPPGISLTQTLSVTWDWISRCGCRLGRSDSGCTGCGL